MNTLAEQGVISSRYRTSKSCPGHKIDMDFIRQQLPVIDESIDHDLPELSVESRQEISNAIAVLQQHREKFPNAQDELDEFIHHPEVISLIN
jgi:hypothetical protein